MNEVILDQLACLYESKYYPAKKCVLMPQNLSVLKLEIDRRFCFVGAELDSKFVGLTRVAIQSSNALDTLALATIRYLQNGFRFSDGTSTFETNKSMYVTRAGEWRAFFLGESLKTKLGNARHFSIRAILDKQDIESFYASHGLGNRKGLN